MENNNVLKKTVEALQKNFFDAHVFNTKEEAVKWLTEQVNSGDLVAFGGSVTLRELGLIDALKEKGADVIDHWQPELTPEERRAGYRKAFLANAYFSSANAITEDGFILNVDGTGNRVAALTYGPDHAYIVAGKNKICQDLEAAEKRRAEIASPKNNQRLSLKNPCAKTGICSECKGKSRICNIYTVWKRPSSTMPMTVVLIDEDLGY